MSFGWSMFWVYVLENPAGSFYVGHTDNLRRRLSEHNAPSNAEGKYTRKNGPWCLVWSEEHPTRASAMARERFIKSRKSASSQTAHRLEPWTVAAARRKSGRELSDSLLNTPRWVNNSVHFGPHSEIEPWSGHTIHFLLMFRKLMPNSRAQKAASSAKSSASGIRPAWRTEACRTSAP